MQLTDTHCHIHSADYPVAIADVDAHCAEAGVTRLICVGVDAVDSERAVAFVQDRPNSWAAIGQHPHEAKFGQEPLDKLRALLESNRAATLALQPSAIPLMKQPPHEQFFVLNQTQKTGAQDQLLKERVGEERPAPNMSGSSPTSPPKRSSRNVLSGASARKELWLRNVLKDEVDERRTQNEGSSTDETDRKIVAIGECGLDYFYGHSSKQDQEKALRFQIELALEYNLPLIFHVREAFNDFWPIFDSYQGIRGELHSFTDNQENLDKALARDLYIGVNGIATFTKNEWQRELFKHLPLEKMLLETDAPFLTPRPLRGKVNEPARVLVVAEFLSDLRQTALQDIAHQTTANARHIFSI